MNLGIGLGLTNYLRVPTVALDPDAAIAALFSSGEEGAWYDPSDLSTLYQDAKGTTPVTGTGQPVGLMLDKSKGLTLGSELVTNGTFDSNGSGWTVAYGTFDFSGGTADAVGSSAVYQNTSSVISGKTYEIAFDITRYVSGSVSVFFNSNASGGSTGAFTGVGSYSAKIQCVATTTTIYVQIGGVSPDAAVDNVSIKELPGNHATQSTPTARPTLQVSGGLYYLDFDGVDDGLSTTFASAQTQPNTLAVGFKFDNFTAKAFDFVFDSPAASGADPRHTLLDSSGTLRAYADINQDLGLSDLLDNVVLVHFNTTDSLARQNGSVAFSGQNVGADTWPGVVIGSDFTGGARSIDGRIYGFIGINRTLTADEIDGVESYLATKSGVTL